VDLSCNNLHQLACHDYTNGSLKYAYKDALGGHVEWIDDSAAYVGTWNSLALTSAGWPAISYWDRTNG